MNTILTFAVVFSYTFGTIRTASADFNNPRNEYFAVQPAGTLAEVNETENTEETIGPSCNTTASHPAPALVDYQDGDTPYPTYYADYLGDFGWWVQENNMCTSAHMTEPDPEQ